MLRTIFNKRAKEPEPEVFSEKKPDRRLLQYVPDPTGVRSHPDRRGSKAISEDMTAEEAASCKRAGIRYNASSTVKVICRRADGRRHSFQCECVDISVTGIQLKVMRKEDAEQLSAAERVRLVYRLRAGTMPEGYEMKLRQYAAVVRQWQPQEGEHHFGLEFSEDLNAYRRRRKDRRMFILAALLLVVVAFMIVLMRAESVIYFKFNKWLYLYSIIAACFLLSRYLFALFYSPVPIQKDFTPGVSVIIPCFNEEEWIQHTILSCLDQDYPVDCLEVIVVDDCSSDRSVEKIQELIDRLSVSENDRFDVKNRLSCYVQEKNMGKREALVRGTLEAKHDLVVFVDSDSFLDPYAIRNLVQPFRDPKMGGVAGRTDVANTYTNGLTRMQSVRYYIAFRIMKAAEGVFDTVTCLSGPLSCYRKEIVLDKKDAWLNQRFLGHKATFGDDRAMTNFVLSHHRTAYQDTAVCETIVPSHHKVFLKQQMRWKRSWLRESLNAGKFMWRKEPFASLNFYIGLIVPCLAPVVVVYNLLYVPVTQHIFPKTFLVGLLLMALLMSFAQLLLRKSSTWLYGIFFCIYYEAILLWQMPIAWFTFWKSTWGTRMTESDVQAQKQKEQKKQRKNGQTEEASQKQEEPERQAQSEQENNGQNGGEDHVQV